MPKSSEVPPEEYLLEENEERSMIEPRVIYTNFISRPPKPQKNEEKEKNQ